MKSATGLLFITTLMMALTSCAQKSGNKPMQTGLKKQDLSKYSKAYFAAGCFWHEEALFESVKGVKEAISGYAGGTTRNPTYEDVETGNTGHAESVEVYYDPSQISYETLLKVYFAGQNPTQVNGQGPDLGTQYRSIAFYTNDTEKKDIENYIQQMTASGNYKAPIAAQVMPLKKFWIAENYHQDYIAHHPDQGYVQAVSIPEIKAFQKEYPQLVKPDHMF
ncbi:peptide-methionine (S)-S-oxide reductase MsrA [Ginsengibacter hankyongi]|uniref:Peptide methionine sulfoxide reductase MsrA n=1 Tax=Ginsengibacter hankyongi TaxID=2607284 RepID=A0A5J5IIN0_9BACT|nr:peptide-methionine (S)-S-oxide reductase MsrA [Ginsengibacter hankyongi]KAA9040889.1 peptide-methionine (S)-S-oxide reductase MsrA [Ginsengibacter hankyongi]